MKKNDIITAEVISLGSEGEGIIKYGETTVFVPFCLEGEIVKVKILKVRDKIAYGRALEIIKRSPDRIEARCPVFGKCGGCDLQHMEYSAQLKFKRQRVASCLKKIGGISFVPSETVRSAYEWEYRNKLQIPVGRFDGSAVVGFFARRSHRIVPAGNCYIQPPWYAPLVKAFSEYMDENGVSAYDYDSCTGDVKFLVVRELEGKAIVTVVTNSGKISCSDKLLKKLSGVFDDFTLVHNENTGRSNVIFGERFTTVYGNGSYEAEEFGIKYVAAPNTFVQVNGNVRNSLYRRVFEEIACDGDEVVFDCYSGGGLLTAMIAGRCKRAYGIEIVPEATACANELKRINGLEGKMINICGDVSKELPVLMKKEAGENIKLILDPPRAGIDREVLKAIIAAKIPELVLISCEPSTLARDLGFLTGTLTETHGGELKKASAADGAYYKGAGEYKIEKIIPFDMFPQTKHVETLVVLSHKKAIYISK